MQLSFKIYSVYRLLLIVLLLLFHFNLISQDDEKACSNIVEFDPGNALYNLDDKIDENSGLIYYNDLFWTLNDSDGDPILFGFNTSTGELKQQIEVSNAVNYDWEDLCQNDDYIFIGDFGNNAGNRKDLKFYRIEKSKINNQSSQEIEAEIIAFQFEDQKDFSTQFRKTEFDCEATVCIDNELFVFTKDWLNGKTKAYKIPNKPGQHKAIIVSSFDIDGLVTAAAYSPDNRYLSILGYKDYVPFLWIFKNNEIDLFTEKCIRINMPAIYRAQTEALVFKNNDSLFLSCEQSIERTMVLFKNVIFPQQMFVVPVKFWDEHFSSEIIERNKNSLRIDNE